MYTNRVKNRKIYPFILHIKKTTNSFFTERSAD